MPVLLNAHDGEVMDKSAKMLLPHSPRQTAHTLHFSLRL